jgi:hypothetical protein
MIIAGMIVVAVMMFIVYWIGVFGGWLNDSDNIIARFFGKIIIGCIIITIGCTIIGTILWAFATVLGA